MPLEMYGQEPDCCGLCMLNEEEGRMEIKKHGDNQLVRGELEEDWVGFLLEDKYFHCTSEKNEETGISSGRYWNNLNKPKKITA